MTVCDNTNFLCIIAWTLTWLSFHSCGYEFFIYWCRYSPSKPCIHKWRRWYASCLTKTLMQSSKQIRSLGDEQINEIRISIRQYWDDCYWHWGKRACCSFRRVCIYLLSFCHSWGLLCIVLSARNTLCSHDSTAGKCVTPFGSDVCRYRKLFSGRTLYNVFNVFLFLMNGSRYGEVVCQSLSLLYNVEVSTVMRNQLDSWMVRITCEGVRSGLLWVPCAHS